MELWDWSLTTVTDTDMKARIRGVQAHMQKFEFFFGSSLAELLLRNADNLSRTLVKRFYQQLRANRLHIKQS